MISEFLLLFFRFESKKEERDMRVWLYYGCSLEVRCEGPFTFYHNLSSYNLFVVKAVANGHMRPRNAIKIRVVL
jgi:hypothetical protein